MASPLVGISTYREPASWGVWHERTMTMLAAEYADSIRAGGSVPLLLPTPADDVDPGRLRSDARDTVGVLDALVIAGGPDVEPSRYGQPPHPATGTPRPVRDAWETALLEAALAADTPVLAICRGQQVLNTVLGGTLHQHLPDVVGTDVHSPTSGAHGRHDVRIDPASRVGAAVGPALSIATYHHQAVDALGNGLVATARADDGVVEAVESTGHRWVVGVQWHPEMDGARDPRLFAALTAAAAG